MKTRHIRILQKLVLTLFLPLFLVGWAQANTNFDTLHVAVNHSPPFIEKNQDGEWTGISVWLWEHIAEDLQLNYRYHEMELDQILTGLKDDQVDLSINPMTITSERSKTIDFSLPFFVSYSNVVIFEKSNWAKIWQFVRSFFSLNFWRVVSALFLVILIFGLLVWVFERRKNPEEFEPGWKGIGSGIWWSAVTMTTVGYGDKSPRSTMGRVVALVWMFAAIILISGFTASIASSLTVNQLSWTQEDINDFKEKPIGTVRYSSHADYLKRNFFQDLKESANLSEGLQALKEQDVVAFVYDEPILKYLVKRDSQYSELTVLPLRFDRQFYAFSFPKNHDTLKDTISSELLEYTENIEWKILLSEYDLTD